MRQLQEQVSQQARGLEQRLAGRLACARGCHACCADELTVFTVEAARIRREFPEVLEQDPHPSGACAFLDAEGACRIYAARPYVCRTQGLPLRWGEERDGQAVEVRDVCPLNLTDDTGPPLEALPASDCWTLGPAEERLRELQQAFAGGLSRVSLRSLFRDPESDGL